jgi:hypothetical protein
MDFCNRCTVIQYFAEFLAVSDIEGSFGSRDLVQLVHLVTNRVNINFKPSNYPGNKLYLKRIHFVMIEQEQK